MTGQQLVNSADTARYGHAYIRFRMSLWAEPGAYMRLSVFEHERRYLGPWAHLYSRETQSRLGERTPQTMLTYGGVFDSEQFLLTEVEEWTGPLDPADHP